MGKVERPASDWNYADVKADLAALGADVWSDAKIVSYAKPTGGLPASFVMVDRVADLPLPPYQVWGFCTCLVCGEYCYLGSETSKAVSSDDNDIYPLCLPCANLHIPREIFGSASDHLDDAR